MTNTLSSINLDMIKSFRKKLSDHNDIKQKYIQNKTVILKSIENPINFKQLVKRNKNLKYDFQKLLITSENCDSVREYFKVNLKLYEKNLEKKNINRNIFNFFSYFLQNIMKKSLDYTNKCIIILINHNIFYKKYKDNQLTTHLNSLLQKKIKSQVNLKHINFFVTSIEFTNPYFTFNGFERDIFPHIKDYINMIIKSVISIEPIYLIY